MAETLRVASEAAYDVVGEYNQDEINGFTEELLEDFVAKACIEGATNVLDAMGGDGNLTLRIIDWCEARGIEPPDLTVLEFSRAQCEFARAKLPDGVKIVHGDAIGMVDLETKEPIENGTYDRVIVKSATHEFPLAEQLMLYRSIYRILRPGGLFINLGFVFDDVAERDEFREITRVKDDLAGMQEAVARRHFLTREELYNRLKEAGFEDVTNARPVQYRIRLDIATRHYFKKQEDETIAARKLLQSQRKARSLRRAGRILLQRGHSTMVMPGEITISRRPEANARKAVSEKGTTSTGPHEPPPGPGPDLVQVARRIPPASKVLEIGCGDGALAELLLDRPIEYHGLDDHEESVQSCLHKFSSATHFKFDKTDIDHSDLGTSVYDYVVFINNAQARVDVPAALLRAREALKPGGRLIVVGGKQWAIEGMITLLNNAEFSEIVEAMPPGIETTGYLIVAQS